MLFEQAVESFLLSDGELPRLNTGVIYAEERVYVIHRLGSDIRELFDLGGGILDLSELREQERTVKL